MTGKRTRYTAEFKAKEALRGELTTAQLAAKHGIHQTMVGEWKRQAMAGLTAVFSGTSAAQESASAFETDLEKLHAKIGQLVGTPPKIVAGSSRGSFMAGTCFAALSRTRPCCADPEDIA